MNRDDIQVVDPPRCDKSSIDVIDLSAAAGAAAASVSASAPQAAAAAAAAPVAEAAVVVKQEPEQRVRRSLGAAGGSPQKASAFYSPGSSGVKRSARIADMHANNTDRFKKKEKLMTGTIQVGA
jgi:hypothetical protein